MIGKVKVYDATYLILESANKANLESQVNTYKRDGWQEQGGVVADNGHLYQAICRNPIKETEIHKQAPIDTPAPAKPTKEGF